MGALRLEDCTFRYIHSYEEEEEYTSEVTTVQPELSFNVGLSAHFADYKRCSYYMEWQRKVYKLPILAYNKDTVVDDIIALGIAFRVHTN